MLPVNVAVLTALVEMLVSVEMGDLAASAAHKFPEQHRPGQNQHHAKKDASKEL